MARKSVLRSALLGRVAVLAVLATGGAAVPLTVERGHHGLWSVQLQAALAESGRGSGGSGSGRGGSGGGDDHGGGGSDSDGGSSGGSSSDGGSGSSGSGSGSDGGGGHGGSSGSGSDDGGHSGSGGDDHGGSGSGSSGDDSSADDNGDDSSSRHGGSSRADDRPRATVDLSDRELDAVMRGESVLVDDRGRALEVEIEVEHGVRTVTVKPHGGDARRNPGPIGTVRAIDAATGPTRDVTVKAGGGLEVEVEHGVVSQKPHGGAAAATATAARTLRGDPKQVGADLSPAEEAALIQGGWQ